MPLLVLVQVEVLVRLVSFCDLCTSEEMKPVAMEVSSVWGHTSLEMCLPVEVSEIVKKLSR